MPAAIQSAADCPSFHQRVLQKIDALAIRAVPATAPHLVTGLRGEEEAFFHLRRHGYTVVARRWRTPKLPGDIDLVAWHGEALCFIEVKTRTGRDIVPAEFAVDSHKQKTLITLAGIFRHRFPEATRRKIPVRFDIVSVYLPALATTSPIEIELFPAAFSR